MSHTREPPRETRPPWYRYSRRQVTSPVNSETTLPPPAENLQRIEEGHNDFDPTVGYLGPASEAGAQGDDSPSEKSRKKRFVGGFRYMAGSLRQAMWPRWHDHPGHHAPGADWHQMPSTTHVPHVPNDQYLAQSPAQPSMRSMQSPAVERWEYPISPRYEEARSQYDPPIPPASVPPPVPPEVATPPGSDTHPIPPQDTWEGTIVVHHEVRPEPPTVPVYPYPMQQAEKPLSETPAIPARGGLSSRIRTFFRELNSLPWIAPERITVDYVPARLRQPGQTGSASGPLSWYGGPPDASRYMGGGNRYSAAGTMLSNPSEPSTDRPREMSQTWVPPPLVRSPPQPDAVPAPYYGNVETPSPGENALEIGEPTVTGGWGTYPTGYVHQPPATDRLKASNLSAPSFPVPGPAASASPQMAQAMPLTSVPRPQPTYAHIPMKGIPPPP